MKCPDIHRKVIFATKLLIAVPRKKFWVLDPTCHPYLGGGWKHVFCFYRSVHFIYSLTKHFLETDPILPPNPRDWGFHT